MTLIEFYNQYSYVPIALGIVLLLVIIGLIIHKRSLQTVLTQYEEKQAHLTTELALQKQKFEQSNMQNTHLSNELAALKEVHAQHTKELHQQIVYMAEIKQKLASIQHNLDKAEQALLSSEQSLKQEQDRNARLSNELASLTTSFEKEKKHSDEKLEQLEKNRALLKTEFEALANEILKNSQKDFKEKGLADMDLFLKPFKQQVTDFKSKVEDIHTQDLKQRAELKAELQHLQELNKDITLKAEELTTALKGQKKTQGNWGELILENVLDRSGLIDGKDFKRQQSFQTDEGRQLPDVVVYLPDDKHLIIDAKVSLNAYTRFVNSDDDAERQVAIKEHVAAVSARIKELSDKNYFDLPDLNSPEMVFMFIPIESAFVEAVKAEESLFQQAIEQKILIATPTTLLTSLNIVRQLWRFEDQNKHSAKLAESASKIYSKLTTILNGLDKLGAQLDKSKDVWAETMKQFVQGRGNLVKQVKDFEKLGVAVQKELPQKLVEQSDLEIES